MSKTGATSDLFLELESQNPAIARAFSSLRRHGAQDIEPPRRRPPSEESAWGGRAAGLFSLEPNLPLTQNLVTAFAATPTDDVLYYKASSALPRILALLLVLLGIGLVAFVARASILHFLQAHWQTVLLPLGGLCVGGGMVLFVARVGRSPLGSVAPPRTDTEDPLKELKDLSERAASRLRATFRFQLVAVLVVGAIFVLLIVWSVVMVSQNRILYASAFGSGSVAMMILTQWKWQPFDRLNLARQQADSADILGTGLRLRMTTIAAIADPSERSRAQWQAVDEYLKSTQIKIA